MRCWNVLLLVCACGSKQPATTPTPKPDTVAPESSDDDETSEEDEVPRDIPPQETDDNLDDTASDDIDTASPTEGSEDAPEDTPEDTGIPSTDSGTEPSIDIDIEPGHRWVGRFYPTTMFGEIRWETANPDGTRCLIEGLLVDITEYEESCSDCDFGVEFTITGLTILIDEGACDTTVLDKEGLQLEYGQGHTQIHTEVDSDVFDLYQLNEGEWHSLEFGFGFIEASEEWRAGTWVFGEEFDATTESDIDAPDEHGSSGP